MRCGKSHSCKRLDPLPAMVQDGNLPDRLAGSVSQGPSRDARHVGNDLAKPLFLALELLENVQG